MVVARATKLAIGRSASTIAYESTVKVSGVLRDSTTGTGASGRRVALFGRERQVLALVADGKDNQTIADALHLSARTVERHPSHCDAKLGLAGLTARAGAAARFAALPSR